MQLHAVLVTVAVLTTACDSDPGAESRAAQEAQETEAAADPGPPPEPPALDSLEEPPERGARVASPEWNDRHRRFEWELRQPKAIFGTNERVTQLLLGDDPAEGIMLTFYGEALEPGEHRVLPATDETRAEHAGKDSGVFIVTVGKPGEGDLRSESGTVTIERADGDAVVGTFDVQADARLRRTSTVVRGRFFARQDPYMDALLSHEAAIRAQLERR